MEQRVCLHHFSLTQYLYLSPHNGSAVQKLYQLLSVTTYIEELAQYITLPVNKTLTTPKLRILFRNDTSKQDREVCQTHMIPNYIAMLLFLAVETLAVHVWLFLQTFNTYA